MNKISYTIAALSMFVAPAAIAKEAPTTFTHDGVKYTYTVTNISDTKRVITGYATPGTPFNLTVSNGKVSGTSNGMPISFKVSDVTVRTGATADLEVASR